MILNKRAVFVLLVLLTIFAIILVIKYKENQDYKTYQGDYPERPETGNINFNNTDTSMGGDKFKNIR